MSWRAWTGRLADWTWALKPQTTTSSTRYADLLAKEASLTNRLNLVRAERQAVLRQRLARHLDMETLDALAAEAEAEYDPDKITPLVVPLPTSRDLNKFFASFDCSSTLALTDMQRLVFARLLNRALREQAIQLNTKE